MAGKELALTVESLPSSEYADRRASVNVTIPDLQIPRQHKKDNPTHLEPLFPLLFSIPHCSAAASITLLSSNECAKLYRMGMA